MSKTIIYISMSLDGYLADINGSVNWLGGDNTDSENFGSYPDFIETVDTVILGHTTYNQIVNELSPDVWPYKGMTSYVLTHKNQPNNENVIFINKDLKTLLDDLKQKSEKNIWICGGASIVNQVIENELFDELVITVIPTLLGNGIPLFTRKEVKSKLKLISTNSYNGIVDLKYELRR